MKNVIFFLEWLTQNTLPLSWWTNRLSIAMVCMFFVNSYHIVFNYTDHREMIISSSIILSTCIGLFIVIIASPNKKVELLSIIFNRHKENP